MGCCNYFEFTDQGDSFESWQGLRGPQGPRGEPGPPGANAEFKGPVASASDLPSTAPGGEVWLVGAASPYEGYFYNGSAWQDLGPVQIGPPGPAGADGTTFVPSVSAEGVISWTNDGGKQNPQPVDIKGPQGPTGPTGADGYSPTVSSTPITGGHRVSVTDADGTTTFDVMDGNDGTGIRRNLLDNAYFVGGGSQLGDGVFPINQRGQTSYSVNEYGIDRWKKINSFPLVLSDGYITINNSSGSSVVTMVQYIATRINVGDVITCSLMLGDGTLISNSGVVASSGAIASCAFDEGSFYYAYNQNRAVFSAGAGKSFNVKACKIELGNAQTLAHQENGAWVLNEIPDYGIELAKCQRYLLKVLGNVIRYANTQLTSGVIDFTVPIPVTMAATGTGVSIAFGTFTLYSVGADGKIAQTPETDFTYTLNYAGTNAVCIRATKSAHGLERALLGISGYALFSCEP